MNPMTSAMRELVSMDELAAMDSPLHRRHPLAKLLVTVIYICAVVSFPVNQLTGMIPMILIPVLLYQLAGIPVSTCFYKLRFILPLLAAVGIWNPILNRVPVLQLGAVTVTAGVISFLTLMVKGILTLMMSFLLIATTNIEKICHALRMLHVPEILVTQLLITYRYIALLLKEAGTMVNAYSLRAPGQKGVHHSAWGSFLGSLLLRSMDRAEELYQSMQMRGFHGSFEYAAGERLGSGDSLYMTVMIVLIVFLRWVNLSVLLGRLAGVG